MNRPDSASLHQPASPFLESGIDPLLPELPEPVRLYSATPGHAHRSQMQSFVRAVFHRTHGADVAAFHPNLLGFNTREGLRAVLGYRKGGMERLFSEQYLDEPADRQAARLLGAPVTRNRMVEVGNFALSDPGHARWVIAATTVFLAAAGHRWVLFTATRPLANAFRRLGLRPLPLAAADPARLPDGGAAWGGYYEAGPVVYLGDIRAGLDKLQAGSWSRRPRLQTLLRQAYELGEEAGLQRVPVYRAKVSS
jgi:Thermostable hemolysin